MNAFGECQNNMTDDHADSESECDDSTQFAHVTMIIEDGDDLFTAFNGTDQVQPFQGAEENADTQLSDGSSDNLDDHDTHPIDDERIGDSGTSDEMDAGRQGGMVQLKLVIPRKFKLVPHLWNKLSHRLTLSRMVLTQ